MTQTWLITGSSVGLGHAIVEAALHAGHRVVATARNPQTLADVVARFPNSVLALLLDVTDADQAASVVRQAIVRFGRVDVLVNNAGFSGVSSLEDMPTDLIRKQFDTNFLGAVQMSKAVLPQMRAQGAGRILLISSIGARIATAGASIYYASKAAVSALAESLALEVGPLGIAVTAIEPGGMRTRFAKPESQVLNPYPLSYEKTVGATVAMMHSEDYAAYLHDPAGHAAMIIRVAALTSPPTRILAGADAFEMGTSADNARVEANTQWETLSRSATVG
jgi:NAD(P)-dependent dehydrogenase (short-subunit alcohol dehydrogenase family)